MGERRLIVSLRIHGGIRTVLWQVASCASRMSEVQINPGPMEYIILNVGATAKSAINRDSQDLLRQACDYRTDLCMSGIAPGRRRPLARDLIGLVQK